MLGICKFASALGLQNLCEEKETVHPLFMEHIAKFGISYGTQEEYKFRQAIFF